ncbi:MAG TPA: ATP-dependent RecD-like DNA helicase [bacterium]|nr:ATP-dependent RecD-like DNA helicase [bacterium]
MINIADNKHENEEERIAGASLQGLESSLYPPCVKERGTFMCPFPLERMHAHPYAWPSSKTHSHFKPTLLHYPAFAAAALPFRWMMNSVVFGDEKKSIRGLVAEYPLEDVAQSFEPDLGFQSYWMQSQHNQKALLDCFWNHVQLEESLVFFYAKQIPLVEDTGQRILIGVGRVLKLGPLTEYSYSGSPEGKLRSLLWERMVVHSIRPDFKDGFLLPYHQALLKSQDGQAFDPAEVVAFAPEDRFNEFSYATEHVGPDAAIASLLACRASLQRASNLFNYDPRLQEQWIDSQLGRLWKKRGAFPGMGGILRATGISMGNFVAQALEDKAGENGNPWKLWDAAVTSPEKYFFKDLAECIDTTIAKAWKRLPTERRQYLELLSRMDLTADQAEMLAVPEVRAEHDILVSDKEIIENPYLVYETTRLMPDGVSIGVVDRAMAPAANVREKHPVPPPSAVKTGVDARRLRALTIREMEAASQVGDTLRPQGAVVSALRERSYQESELPAEVTGDFLRVAEEETFSGEIRLVEMADGSRAYQLERLAVAGALIRSTVLKRAGAERHNVAVDWRVELDGLLGPLPEGEIESAQEERARTEKAAALAEVAASRMSVLIGSAGTGKTTLLSVLCRRPEVTKDGIVMIAPTGKARVRMEDVARRSGVTDFKAFTLAQFLLQSDPPRFDFSQQRYRLTGGPGEKIGRTVIVDECSMLTEEMLAALLESLSGVHRLILVGDPRQLPPIGAGRPFADVIAQLKPQDIESCFPRVGTGYAELTVPRRQGAGEREDLQLASWFGGASVDPGEDQVFEILAGKRSSSTIQFVRWDTGEELERALPAVLASNLGFELGPDEWRSFAISVGGQTYEEHVYFHRGNSGKCAEAWQVLSPVRQRTWGVESLNRLLHLRFKAKQLENCRADIPKYQRRFPVPFGDQQIVYGDKVINTRNQTMWKSRIYPATENGYLANGEIGVVVGQMRTKKFNYEPRDLQVEFSSQLGKSFTFYKPGGDDDNFSLELAYALTVHKAQGSEFDIVFLVLPKSPLMLTRELLYTALTRQKTKVVILHQGSATDLQRLSSERYSATAARLTNLFSAPKLVAVGDLFLEERLIHRTAKGEAVRSKSEVIIANLLHASKVPYHYEHPLEFGGVVKYPDFTIEDDDSGITYYWEHCGMLHDASYRRRWDAKVNWYREYGIFPLEQGGGPSGTLLVTRDNPDGGLDSAGISDLVRKVFKL